MGYMADNGIGTLIHYPVPPYEQEGYKELKKGSFPITDTIHNEVVSLPMSPVLKESEYITKAINSYQ